MFVSLLECLDVRVSLNILVFANACVFVSMSECANVRINQPSLKLAIPEGPSFRLLFFTARLQLNSFQSRSFKNQFRLKQQRKKNYVLQPNYLFSMT